MAEQREYEMSEADLKDLLERCKPMPYIIVGGVPPPSPQERANWAWEALGRRMGFDYMTVQPSGRGDRFFYAVSLPTPGLAEVHIDTCGG